VPELSVAALHAIRSLVTAEGVGALQVDDLHDADLAWLGWSGSPLHIKSVAAALERRATGEVDYLAVRAPGGEPIAKGGVDNANPRGPGMLWQLATHPALQSLGLGSALINGLEGRIRRRGLRRAWLGVEIDNRRARVFYERLGYEPFAEAIDGWEAQREDGSVYWHRTTLLLMQRHL
jgi:ribosomal protein S18 acetylase RimI-like enzyme